MIDVSDGLATDLHHLAGASGTGALLRADWIPVSEDAAPASDASAALAHALRDGEDFELLFTLPPGRKDQLVSQWSRNFEADCTLIGEMTPAGQAVVCVDADGNATPIEPEGFEHFRPSP
jgi:thiamine-monophosphate kinase